MSDIFISYSRKNLEFVRELHQALTNQNLDVWLDLEDIPPAVNFELEIYPGIESADNFLYAVSEDSISSKYCDQELAHALKMNKRIIPVLHQSVNANRLMPPVNKINWIDFATRPFDEAFMKLLDAVRTDQDLARDHKTYLVRARQWEQQKRDKSQLLTGQTLLTAEQWRDSSIGKHPVPTPLHIEYIAQSRQAFNRSQRNRIWSLRGALIVTTFLTIAIGFLAQIAQNNERTANNNAATAIANFQRADSLRLAAEANAIIQTSGGNMETAALLALRSLKQSHTSQARDALLETLPHLRAQRILDGNGLTIQQANFTPDGEAILVVGAGGIVQLWDARTSEIKQGFAQRHRGDVKFAALSPTGNLLFTAGYDGRVIGWDVVSGQQVWEFDKRRDSIKFLTVSPDGRYVLTGGTDYQAKLLNTANGGVVKTFDHGVADVNGGAFLSDDRILTVSYKVVPTIKSSTIIWDQKTGSQISNFDLIQFPVTQLAISPDQTLLALAAGGGAQIWDIASGKPRFTLAGSSKSIMLALAFSPDGRYLLTGLGQSYTSEENIARLWDAKTGQLLETYHGHTSVLTSVSFSRDSSTILTASADSTIRLWPLRSIFTGQAIPIPTPYPYGVFKVVFSPDGKLLATLNVMRVQGETLSSPINAVRIYETTTGMLVQVLPQNIVKAEEVRFSPDGRYVFTSSTVVQNPSLRSDQALTLNCTSEQKCTYKVGLGARSVVFKRVNTWWEVRTGKPAFVDQVNQIDRAASLGFPRTRGM